MLAVWRSRASELSISGEAIHRDSVENVSKTYDGQRRAALEDINVDIDKGEFVFWLGLRLRQVDFLD